ncbi:ExbD/TolR family protein [Halocola ammonii]
MKNRRTPSLNVGSMADIAFLLLIFFLVSTTIESDEGITQHLPKWDADRNSPTPRQLVLDIKINGSNELLVNDERTDIAGIIASTNSFYTNSGVFENKPVNSDFPIRKWVDKNRCLQMLRNRDSEPLSSSKVEYWNDLSLACEELGAFKAFPDRAVIHISYSADTEYSRFIEVRNAVEMAMNKLRDQLAMKQAGKKFNDLNNRNEKERKLKKAIMVVYPQSISDELLTNKKVPQNGTFV